ncbi:hypothetical protein SIN8267_02235 [Sinobacterium norvegicum]|uniref:HTH marR-type domain-containing protein n=1 Tax=Sinobacterium norvegicum TaxID=1641715 RepID=A0ABN8EJ73_9GAMM|nr:MarR family transcriptional regulator [Sinobacterium norvegicum]CAH0992119.1 hypothetical protein SIN8267_02235 [Sinobacterium norvegicum]
MSTSPGGKAVLDLVFEILKTAPKLQLKGDKLTQDTGLTSSRWWCLVTIAENDGSLSVADIARRMNLQRQTVQRFTDALAKSEMITYTENPDHKRARHLSMTDKGKAALVTVKKRDNDWAENTAGAVNSDDIETTIRTLTALRDEITAQFTER